MGVIQSSGTLSLRNIQTAIFGSSGSQGDLNDTSYRLAASLGNNDAVIPSRSQFKWSDFYGKGILNLTNSGTVTDYNLRTAANSGGYGSTYNAGKTLINFTNSGTVSASTTGTYALDTGTFTSGDKVYVNNSGYIVGKGGAGGKGGSGYASFPGRCIAIATGGSAGGGGGAAMITRFITWIVNNGTIGGGGGGGAGGSGFASTVAEAGAGGGGGAGFGGGGGGGDVGINSWNGTFCFLANTGVGPSGNPGIVDVGGAGITTTGGTSGTGGSLGAAASTGAAGGNSVDGYNTYVTASRFSGNALLGAVT